MKRKLDVSIVSKWAKEVGGGDEAARQVSKTIECSVSKALKIVRGWYHSTPMPTEQKELAKLMNVTRDELFPLLEQTKSRTQSAS